MYAQWYSWKEEEHKLLKELYPKESKEVILATLKNHSWAAIQKKASKLKLKRHVKSYTKQNKKEVITRSWSTYEHEVLEIFYPRSSKEVILDTLRTRSWKEIVCEANVLGIKRYVKDDNRKKKKIAYTVSKKKLEKLLYGMEYTIEEIAEKLKTTPDIVRRNISRYGL
jgi:hypothetical protein